METTDPVSAPVAPPPIPTADLPEGRSPEFGTAPVSSIVPSWVTAPTLPPPPLPECLVEVRHLHRVFDNVHAVRDLNFDIRRGQVVGFIGANGAGKTTTMRIMATLDSPTSGTVKVAGENVMERPEKVRRLIGWMPDHFGTYSCMTVFEYLDFFARAYGFKKAERRARVEEVMDFADLLVLADRPMNKLSKGMGQRLCFGRMLLPDPEFMILDEPAAGLDPKARLEFKNLVRLLAQRGKTLFISSHILSELGEMCDTLLFIDGGQLVYHGAADALRRGTGKNAATGDSQLLVDITVLAEVEQLYQWATLNPGWSLIEKRRDGARLAVASDDPQLLAAGLKKMVNEGIPVVEFHREVRRLEDAFVDMLKKPQ
ncbi:MAG: ABC transporter ATP-binding protein [Verrucomicrobium sp.]|nr:ABC transporter ATP-binding protein [Verrucomicrobium sp.]